MFCLSLNSIIMAVDFLGSRGNTLTHSESMMILLSAVYDSIGALCSVSCTALRGAFYCSMQLYCMQRPGPVFMRKLHHAHESL